ncbi:hypothetical protein ABT389_36780 [Streptomyces bacillaris]|uniref:hypothetical protein n=1 Tax=Streptomyces bacillaris TaxID=68179 RepID=UPI00335596B1
MAFATGSWGRDTAVAIKNIVRGLCALSLVPAHGFPVGDLLVGVDRAVHCLPARRAPAPGAAQLTIRP